MKPWLFAQLFPYFQHNGHSYHEISNYSQKLLPLCTAPLAIKRYLGRTVCYGRELAVVCSWCAIPSESYPIGSQTARLRAASNAMASLREQNIWGGGIGGEKTSQPKQFMARGSWFWNQYSTFIWWLQLLPSQQEIIVRWMAVILQKGDSYSFLLRKMKSKWY